MIKTGKHNSSPARKLAIGFSALVTSTFGLAACSSSEPTKATVVGFDRTLPVQYESKDWVQESSTQKPKEVEGNLKIIGSRIVDDGDICIDEFCFPQSHIEWDYSIRRWKPKNECTVEPKVMELRIVKPRSNSGCIKKSESEDARNQFYREASREESFWIFFLIEDQLHSAKIPSIVWGALSIGSASCIDMATEPPSLLADEKCTP